MKRWLLIMAALSTLAGGCLMPSGRPAGTPSAGKIDPYAVLAEALVSGQPPLESLAMETLLEADCPPPLEPIEALADTHDPRVRMTAVVLLGSTRQRNLLPLFQRKERDAEAVVRLAAAYAMAMTGDASQVTALRDALASRDVTLCRTAAWLLGLMGNPSAAGMLKLKLDDLDAVVVLRAAEALHRLGSSDGLEVVQALTEHEHHQVRYYATRLLGRIGSTADIPRLERLCQSRFLDVKFAAIAALAERGDFKRIDLLLDMLSAPEVEIRILAARELGETAYTPALEPLAKRLGAKDPMERTTAAVAIVRIQSAKRSWRTRILADQPPPPIPAQPAGPLPK